MLTSGEQLTDPYLLKDKWSDDIASLPEITWRDVTKYLLDTPSTYTKDLIKAYKSLEAMTILCVGIYKTVVIMRYHQNQNFASSDLRYQSSPYNIHCKC